VPLHLQVSQAGERLTAALEDGDQKTVATQSESDDNGLTLKFSQYATTLRLTRDGLVLRGVYSKDNGAFSYPVELRRHASVAVIAQKIPKIAGIWIIPTESPKGEHAWRLIVHQTGSTATATILRIDGDTGTLRW
jgi:hypothetical protein